MELQFHLCQCWIKTSGKSEKPIVGLSTWIKFILCAGKSFHSFHCSLPHQQNVTVLDRGT